MYRKRRKRLSRRRRKAAVVALAAALAVTAAVPSVAFGQSDVIDNVLNTLGLGSGSSGGGTSPQQLEPPDPAPYQPPLHGTNPHGQGTVGVVDVLPTGTRPLSGDTDGGDGSDQEEVVIGRSRGEQNEDGSYHGHITFLALFGNEVAGVDTGPGESEEGPFAPLNNDLLGAICDESMGNICLQLLDAESCTETSECPNGSENHFQVLEANIGGEGGLETDVGESNGNISDDGTCQTAHGDSTVASVNAGGSGVVQAFHSESDSTACNDGTPDSVNQDSYAIQLGGEGLPIPCDATAENDAVLVLLVQFVCNASDENTTQANPPYGVREAFNVILVPFEAFGVTVEPGDPNALLKTTTAASESHAVAPPKPPPTPPTPTTPTQPGAGAPGGQQGGEKGPSAGREGAGEGAGGAAGEAAAGGGQLAFTGADLLVLGLVGGALILGGLALTATARRRHRGTV
jgi:hypothetical protein